MENQENGNRQMKEWVPGHYFDKVPLSTTPTGLMELLGKPDEKEEDVYDGGDQSISYWYDEPHQFYVSFDYYDGSKEAEVSISGYEIYLLGKPLHELNFENLLGYFKSIKPFFIGPVSLPYFLMLQDILNTPEKLFEYASSQVDIENEESIEYYFPYLGASFWYINDEMSDFNIGIPDRQLG